MMQFVSFVEVYLWLSSFQLLSHMEFDAEAQGFVERCSFEQGLCSWAGSDVDTPDAEWSRHRGGDAWPRLGPHRDHTQNSAAGIGASEL